VSLEKCKGGKGWSLCCEPNRELPNTDEGGGPAGVKEPADDGGGPAGVVEGLDTPKGNCLAPSLELLSGVDGGLEDSGTWNPDIFSRFRLSKAPHM
jgi:hypothetical protein